MSSSSSSLANATSAPAGLDEMKVWKTAKRELVEEIVVNAMDAFGVDSLFEEDIAL